MNKPLILVGASAAALLAGRWMTRRRRLLDLRDRSAVVTGGSRGLGMLIASELCRAGARVALLARDEDELRRARSELETRDGADVLIVVCDVGDPASLESALAEVVDEHGGLDVLVNNAGTIEVGPLAHMEVDDFERAMAVHFWGPLTAMRAAVPLMKARGGGRIVNVSSVGGKVAVPHLAPYCASKFALTGLSDAMRAELSRDGIYVTTVVPGLMRTGSHVNAAFKGRHREEFSWFAVGAGAYVVTLSARRAARRIVAAARHGQRALHLGVPARLLVLANALAPSLTGEVMALVNTALPRPAQGDGQAKAGWDSHSRVAPSRLTRRADRAAEEHNELRGHDPGDLYRRGR